MTQKSNNAAVTACSYEKKNIKTLCIEQNNRYKSYPDSLNYLLRLRLKSLGQILTA